MQKAGRNQVPSVKQRAFAEWSGVPQGRALCPEGRIQCGVHGHPFSPVVFQSLVLLLGLQRCGISLRSRRCFLFWSMAADVCQIIFPFLHTPYSFGPRFVDVWRTFCFCLFSLNQFAVVLRTYRVVRDKFAPAKVINSTLSYLFKTFIR